MNERNDLFGDDFDDDDFNFEDDIFADDDDFGGDFDEFAADDDFGGGDDFDFGGEELFDDEVDDFGGGADDFTFEDDDEFSDIDDFDLDSFGDEDEELFAEDEEDEGRGGPFIILAGIMILLFAIGIGAVVFLALSGDDDSPADQTRVARDSTADSIVATNNFIETEQAGVDLTQQALDATGTVEAVTRTFEEEGTATAQALGDIQTQTADALSISGTETAIAGSNDATLTAQALDLTATADALIVPTEPAVETEPPVEETPDTVGIDAGATATALVGSFRTLTAEAGGAGVTPGGGAVTAASDATARPPGTPITDLPQTGLLDETTSAGGMGIIALMAFGLIGIIFGARRLRAANNRKD